MTRKMYYEVPTQVKFVDFDSDDLHWIGGIAYRDEIICGCCGGVVSISEFCEDANDLGYTGDCIVEMSWIDISEEIKGE